jgi:hypothetical protein
VEFRCLKYGDDEVYKRSVDRIKRVGKPGRPTEETRRERKFGHRAASDREGGAGCNDRVGLRVPIAATVWAAQKKLSPPFPR